MNSIHQLLIESDEMKAVINGINEGIYEQLVAGLTGSSRTLFMATLFEEMKHPTLVVTHNLYQAQKIYDDLTEWLHHSPVYLYPVNDLISAEIAVASPELRGQRIEVLNFLSQGGAGIVVTPIAGLRRLLSPKSNWKKAQIVVRQGEDLALDSFIEKLIYMGYERKPLVTTPGEFSIRGGIIDIYPLTEENPIRLELFDTEVESIRYFDSDSQRSKETIEKVSFGPAKELIVTKEQCQKSAMRLEDHLKQTLKEIKNQKVKEKMTETIHYEMAQLKEGHLFPEAYKYMSLFYEENTSLLDYLPPNGIVVMDEISRIQELSLSLEKEEAEWYTSLLEDGAIPKDIMLSHPFSSLIMQKRFPFIYLSLFLRHVPNTNPQNIVNISCKSMQNFHGQFPVLKGELERFHKNRSYVIFAATNKERAVRLKQVLEDYQIESEILPTEGQLVIERPQIITADLSGGFELPMLKLVVITEKEVFTKVVKKSRKRQKLSNAERIKSYSELQIGDYVVHINHGIGKYLGIQTLEINGIHKDYLHIKYAGNDQLYVPVEQIDQVQKYVGSEGKEPKVYKLGGTEWKKVKKKVQSSVEDIADDLIKLYAEREAAKGYAFSQDGAEQQEFEGLFPYHETEDQLRTIAEIKADMEKSRPMDRLLCGDVGYGKTEVALRAAFKAIIDNKQVAFLVPTTILAQQHYETIRERFQNYPVNIGLLSRFRTKKEQNETIKGLKNGTIDIVIGTHRLLSKDVQYRDLGLLIIDEEQRFGVKHKEKIKQMKANVDVLTLTATPIPRTLHMSMIGVRDLSVIETPPENRFPVQTYVVEYSSVLVREAIERELAREGQVYFLYNRVEDIERKADEIATLIPDARVAFAHGKMTDTELESVMIDFLEGNYDVLVSTTIIETGVDIPNVNTLIVYDADKMGLSQLYQLRGRVGRSNRVAYAYFTYQRDKVLTEVAEKRLQAIKEFTELGSGFKIAMRDLSIRGAGNILGAQQHGFIDSVGFDMYSQMLKEAIEIRRQDGEIREQKVKIEVDLQLDAYLPEAYISDEKQKIDMYKRFKAIDTVEDVEELETELIDRFGPYPKEVLYLIQVATIKALGEKEKVESIIQKNQTITLLFSQEATDVIQGSKMFVFVHGIGEYISPGMEGTKLKIVMNIKNVHADEYLQAIEKMLRKLKDVKKEKVETA